MGPPRSGTGSGSCDGGSTSQAGAPRSNGVAPSAAPAAERELMRTASDWRTQLPGLSSTASAGRSPTTSSRSSLAARNATRRRRHGRWRARGERRPGDINPETAASRLATRSEPWFEPSYAATPGSPRAVSTATFESLHSSPRLSPLTSSWWRRLTSLATSRTEIADVSSAGRSARLLRAENGSSLTAFPSASWTATISASSSQSWVREGHPTPSAADGQPSRLS